MEEANSVAGCAEKAKAEKGRVTYTLICQWDTTIRETCNRYLVLERD